MSIQQLKSELDSGKIRNLYLFYGPEDFLIKKYIHQLEEKTLHPDCKQMNRDVFEGPLHIEKLIGVCESHPFFGEKRLVLVRESGFFSAKTKGLGDEKEEAPLKKKAPPLQQGSPKGKPRQKNNEDSFQVFIENLPQHVVLIFWENQVDKRLKRLEQAKEKGLVVEYPYQKADTLKKWIQIELHKHHFAIREKDAELLLDYSEPEMSQIDMQLQKLMVYAHGKKQITAEDIELICHKAIKTIIFELVDAISQKDIQKAFLYLDDMIEKKEPMHKIFFMMGKQFSQILNTKSLLLKGCHAKDVALTLGVHPFVAEKLCKHAKRFSVEGLKRAVKDTYDMDWLNKSTSMDPRLSAEILIAKLAKL
jgi:DNA polymerase III subunit delta